MVKKMERFTDNKRRNNADFYFVISCNKRILCELIITGKIIIRKRAKIIIKFTPIELLIFSNKSILLKINKGGKIRKAWRTLILIMCYFKKKSIPCSIIIQKQTNLL